MHCIGGALSYCWFLILSSSKAIKSKNFLYITMMMIDNHEAEINVQCSIFHLRLVMNTMHAGYPCFMLCSLDS
jgi:hypothetical protein